MTPLQRFLALPFTGFYAAMEVGVLVCALGMLLSGAPQVAIGVSMLGTFIAVGGFIVSAVAEYLGSKRR